LSFRQEIHSFAKWLALTAVALAAIGGIWMGLNLYRGGAAAMDKPLPSHCDFVEDKVEKLRNLDSPKWVVYGLSNTLYGFLARHMSERLGVPVYNFAVVATLPPSMSLEYLKTALLPGDVVILDIPYWALAHAYQRSQEAQSNQFAFECNERFFWQASFSNQMKFYFSQDPATILTASLSKALKSVGFCLFESSCIANHFFERTCNGQRKFDNGRHDIYCAISARTGDLTEGNEVSRRTEKMLEKVRKEHQGLENQGIWEDGFVVRALDAFIDWAHAHHIRIIAVPPPGWWPKDIRNTNITDGILRFYAKKNVPFIGTPLQFFWDVGQFFDTNNHLTRPAMIRRTDMLSDALAKHFECSQSCAH